MKKTGCALAVGVLLAACGGDSTGPDAFSLSVFGPPALEHGHHAPGDGFIYVDCSTSIDLVATGPADRVAVLGPATFEWRDAFDGNLVFSDALTPDGTRSFWGTDRLAGGERAASNIHFYGNVPFRLTMVFEYGLGRRTGTVVYSFVCAPPARPPTGLWALQSIRGEPLPVPAIPWDEVRYDSLRFLPNMTYLAKSEVVVRDDVIRTDWEQTSYFMPARDSLLLPMLGRAGGGVSYYVGNVIRFEPEPGLYWVYSRVSD